MFEDMGDAFLGTFLKSHHFQLNQKVVANEHGVFVTLEGGVLMRSEDGGKTFKQVFHANRGKLKPPTLETDEDSNIYLIYPEQKQTLFFQFNVNRMAGP